MTNTTNDLSYVFDDGGRAAAGFSTRKEARDCVARSIAIVSGEPYAEVYAAVAHTAGSMGGRRSARDGVPRGVWQQHLAELGWQWTPKLRIGQRERTRLRRDELPGGRLVCNLSKHATAVIDGVIHDTFDPRLDGNSVVYGYWMPRYDRANV